MITLRVNVTQKDIDKGCKNSAANCPIAVAIARLTKARAVSVGRSSFGYWPDGSDYIHMRGILPKSAQTFIQNFDNYNPVKPFRFRINPETDYVQKKAEGL